MSDRFVLDEEPVLVCGVDWGREADVTVTVVVTNALENFPFPVAPDSVLGQLLSVAEAESLKLARQVEAYMEQAMFSPYTPLRILPADEVIDFKRYTRFGYMSSAEAVRILGISDGTDEKVHAAGDQQGVAEVRSGAHVPGVLPEERAREEGDDRERQEGVADLPLLPRDD